MGLLGGPGLVKRRVYRQEREQAKQKTELQRQQEAELLAHLKRAEEVRLRVRKLRHEEHYGMDFFVFEKGKITNEKELGIWHHEGNTVFMRCIGCLTILKIDWDDVDERGFTENCIICPSRHCRMHQYIRFEGLWDKEVPKK